MVRVGTIASMTGAWAAMVGAALTKGVQADAPKEFQLGDSVRIVCRSFRTVAETGLTEFSDGVTIYYGPTTLTAEKVVANYRSKTGEASGNVVVTDPEGTLQATDVELNWATGQRRATAKNVFIELAGARLQAANADLTDTLWVFTDVQGTTCRKNTPLYSVRTPRFEVVPGKSGRVVKPRISLFGKPILTLPTQRFNLDPRVQGIRIPNFAYRRDQGFGIAWNGQFLLNQQTAAGFDFGAFRGGYPTFSFGASRSFVPSTKTTALISPRDDLSDRFALGYFDSIELDSPDAGYGYLSNPRSTLAVSSQFNRGAVIGPPELSYSKPIDLTFERGGRKGDLGLLGQVRAQSIRTQFSPVVNRISVGGTALTKVVPLGRRVGVLGSLDAQSWFGGNTHAWARGSAGLVYQPDSHLTLGAAGFYGRELGTADFPADDLYAKSGYALRADFRWGGFRGRYMVKYDTDLRWYDREYSINQVVGCLEAFMLYRQYPQTYQIGVTLRVDQFVQLLQRRKFERTQPVKKTVISGGP